LIDHFSVTIGAKQFAVERRARRRIAEKVVDVKAGLEVGVVCKIPNTY
jgi:hypothetical protein